MEIKGIKFGFHSFPWKENAHFAPIDLAKSNFQYTEFFGNILNDINQMDLMICKTNAMMNKVNLFSCFYDNNLSNKRNKEQIIQGIKFFLKEKFKPLGLKSLIFSGGIPDKKVKKNELSIVADFLNEMASISKKYGINIMVQPQQDRVIFDKKSIEQLLSFIDTDYVKICPDTAQLNFAKINFKNFLKEYKKYVDIIHLTDFNEEQNVTKFGSGKANIKNLIKDMVDEQYQGIAMICSTEKNLNESVKLLENIRRKI